MSEKNLYSEVKRRKMEALGKAKIVKAVEKFGKILTISGKYDQPEKVIKYTYASVKDSITPKQFNKINLNKYDFVVIGCPGNEIPSQYHYRFREFVENGGWILSTDWVLRTIIEPLFPGYIRWNNEKTADTVVSCEIVDPSHPFMHGVIESLKSYKGKGASSGGPKSYKVAALPGKQPTFRWWLEDKSFPIEVLRKNDVKVLIKSYEIQKKWGAAPVFVYFTFGRGLVAHFISHTHLQKGASKGKFASAIIITNLLDECVKYKYGVDIGGSGGYRDPNQPQRTMAPPYFDSATSAGGYKPAFGSMQDQAPYSPGGQYYPQSQPTYDPNIADPSQSVMPGQDKGITPEFGGVAKAFENQLLQDRTQRCVVCGGDFISYQGRIMECDSCNALYHFECLQQQIDLEGVCRSCGKVLLY
ncbi:MAG: PHD finger domain-containing protein [Promethearchaeota archaeon]